MPSPSPERRRACHYCNGSGDDWNRSVCGVCGGSGLADAQGIVTEGRDPKGLGEREARVEPGPAKQDAPTRDGVDSSPEAIAAMLERLTAEGADHTGLNLPVTTLCDDAAALLAQVARERDEARAMWDKSLDETERQIAASKEAERQLAEARAALQWYGEKAESLARYMAGNDRSQWKLGAVEAILTELSLDAGQRKARALLSGETTRVEDEP